MLFLAYVGCKVLVDHLAERTPCVVVVHYQQVIAFGDEIMGDVGRWSGTVERTFLVKHLFHQTTIGDDYCGRGPKFEGEQAAIDLGPLCEPVNRSGGRRILHESGENKLSMSPGRGKLMYIADQGESGRSY